MSTTQDDDCKSPQYYAIVETTHSLAADAAQEVAEDFRLSLTSSLHHARTHLAPDRVAPFVWDEVELGQLLGSGEFSHVYEIKSFNLRKHPFRPSVMMANNLADMRMEDLDQRLHMKTSEKHRTNKPRYALKYIKPEHLETHDGRMKYIHSAQ